MVSFRFFEGPVIFLGIEANGCWQLQIPGASGPSTVTRGLAAA